MMTVLSDQPQNAGDVRPIVALPRNALSGPALFFIAVIAGLILFAVLEGRRQSSATPAIPVTTAGDIATGSSAIPPLYIPPFERQSRLAQPVDRPAIDRPAPVQQQQRLSPPFINSPSPQSGPAPMPPPPAPTPLPPRVLGGTVLVIDGARQSTAGAAAGGNTPSSAGDQSTTIRAGGRTLASRLANQSTTIVQGTIMTAVLETGIDSTRPGLVRALIQYDAAG
jgi:type IV secretion system protein VirB10